MDYRNIEHFKALVQESTFSSGGLLNSAQGSEFTDLLKDESLILKECRIEEMTTKSLDLDSIDMASRQMRKHSAGVEGDSATLTSDRQTLTIEESKIWFPLDMRTLQRLTVESDGKVEMGKLMRHIMEMGARAFGNDAEDLGLNGDVAETGDDFLGIMDGWIKKLLAGGVTYNYGTSQDWEGTIFKNMLKNMPQKYRTDRNALRFFTTADIYDEYIDQLGDAGVTGSLEYKTGDRPATYKGIKIVPVPKMPTGSIILTNPKNLAFGIDKDNIVRDWEKKAVTRVMNIVIIAAIGYQLVVPGAAVYGYAS